MPRRDRTFSVLDIIRFTSKNMTKSEMRKLYFWFQVIIPVIVLHDLFEETIFAGFAPKNPLLRFFVGYRKISNLLNINITKYIIKAFLPKDYLTILDCINSIQNTFGVNVKR